MYYTEYPSPCGTFYLCAVDEGLCRASWKPIGNVGNGTNSILDIAKTQLDEYFNGTRREFDVPLYVPDATPFQRMVWSTLLSIPYGTTITYKDEALMLGNPNAIRAVAHANALNPLCLFIPCHRVIGSNNTLTGYSGGIPRKQFLLEFEAKNMVK